MEVPSDFWHAVNKMFRVKPYRDWLLGLKTPYEAWKEILWNVIDNRRIKTSGYGKY